MSAGPHQLFPALDSATELALRESIRRFGVLVPVVRDQHGQIIDGHHRSRIAAEEGVEFRVDVVQCDDDQAREIAATLNTDRRHLDAGQRREIVVALREAGHSLRSIAGAVGVGKDTVAKDLGQVSTDRHLTPVAVRGADGKSYPATRPTPADTSPAPAPAFDDWPDEHVLAPVAEPKPVRAAAPVWSESELERKQLAETGHTVVANLRHDHALIEWAKANDRFERIDRVSVFGNPFVLGPDGDRTQVIAKFRDHYLPHKPSITTRLPDLTGKVLGCWCHPEPCHGDVLVEAVP